MRLVITALMLTLFVLVAECAAPPARPAPRVDAFGDELPVGAIARIGTGRFRFDGLPTEIALSLDGKLAAVRLIVNGVGVTGIMETASGRMVSSLFDVFIGDWMVFSRDGKHLISANSYGFRIHDLRQGNEIRKVKLDFKQAHRFALSGNEQIAAASSFANPNAKLVVYDLKADKVLANMEAIHGTGIGLALSHEGKWLASFGDRERGRGQRDRTAATVQLWDTATGKEVKRIEIDRDDTITAAAFSPDGKTLALWVGSATVQLWDHAAGRRLRTWHGPERYVGIGLGFVNAAHSVFTFSPDSKYLLQADRNTPFAPAVWDMATGRRVRVGPMPACGFLNVGFDKGRLIALGLQGQTLFAWDLLRGTPANRGDELPNGPVSALGWQGDRIVVVADRRGSIWTTAGKRIELLPTSSRPLRPVDYRGEANALSPDGKILATALPGPDSRLIVRNLRSAEPSIGLFRPGEEAMPQVFSPDSQLLALSAYDYRAGMYRVHLLRADSGEELLTVPAGKMLATGAAIDPGGKRLAIALAPPGNADERGALLTWRIDQNKEDAAFNKVALVVRRLEFQRQYISPLVYSPDGALLARVVLGEMRQVVRIYDATSGEERLGLDVGDTSVIAPVFSPDSRTLAVASASRSLTHTVTLWEVRTGKVRWSGPLPATPTALAFSPSGQLLVSGHKNGTALVWDVTGQYAAGKRRTMAEYDVLWRDLADGGAMTAFTAQRHLAADGNHAVDALRQRLKPAEGKSLGDAALSKLVEQLDDDDPEMRQKARAALEQQGRAAEGVLRKALEGKPSAEVKRSVTALLARLNRPLEAGEERAALRAVEVLEWIGTPEARQIVETLARGWDAALLTRDAKATLARMTEPRTK